MRVETTQFEARLAGFARLISFCICWTPGARIWCVSFFLGGYREPAYRAFHCTDALRRDLLQLDAIRANLGTPF